MSRAQGWWVIGLLVVMCVGFAAGSVLPDRVQIVGPAPQQRWEYQVDYVQGMGTEVELNRSGEAGWELVSARWARDGEADSWGYEVILRRPR